MARRQLLQQAGWLRDAESAVLPNLAVVISRRRAARAAGRRLRSASALGGPAGARRPHRQDAADQQAHPATHPEATARCSPWPPMGPSSGSGSPCPVPATRERRRISAHPGPLADSRNRRVVHDRHWGQHQSSVGNPRAGTKQRLWPARCRWPGSASSVSRTRIRRGAGGPMRTLTHKPATTAAFGRCHATRWAAGALRRPEPSGQRVGIGRAFLRLHQEGDTK